MSNRFDNRVNVCIHDTTGCQTGLITGCIVYTNIPPVAVRSTLLSNRLYNPVWQPVEQTAVRTTRLSNRFDNRVERTVAVRSTRLSNWVDNRLYRVNKHSTGCQTGLTTGWMFVYTIQPVVKPVVQQVWQPAVSCKRGITQSVAKQLLKSWRTSETWTLSWCRGTCCRPLADWRTAVWLCPGRTRRLPPWDAGTAAAVTAASDTWKHHHGRTAPTPLKSSLDL